jgi:hypothetical protein
LILSFTGCGDGTLGLRYHHDHGHAHGYNFSDNFEEPEKEESRCSLQSNGLTHNNEWRGRRVVLGTNGAMGRELPDKLLQAFKDWCASPEMLVMSASFMAVLSPNPPVRLPTPASASH